MKFHNTYFYKHRKVKKTVIRATSASCSTLASEHVYANETLNDASSGDNVNKYPYIVEISH